MPIDHLTCVSCGGTEKVDQTSNILDRHCTLCGGSLIDQRLPGHSLEAVPEKAVAQPPVQLVASTGIS